jgi:hypothetical protein
MLSVLFPRHPRNHTPRWELRAPSTAVVAPTTIATSTMGETNDRVLPSPISQTFTQDDTNQLGAPDSTSQPRATVIDTSAQTVDDLNRPSLETMTTSSTVDSFASAVSTPVSMSVRPDKPARLPPPIPTDDTSDTPPRLPPKDNPPTRS